ncbi:MAG: hypothetical protein AB1529_03655 [Candidatus Micrarchaeota archaeon]
MRAPIVIAAVVLALLAAGCIQPVQKLGCCLKENISEGCMLYNTTDFLTYNLISQTNGLCDDNATNTTGHCNVSVGTKSYLIPVCTQDQIVPCISQNCTAMVCGDFKFKPQFAPGFVTSGNDTSSAEGNVEGSSGDIPPDTGEGGAANFYKAQCRFLTMDAKLRQIMRSSKSSINVFRVGVGGSFDEFDQYRYFFPLSDKFCNINSGASGAQRVDRYMNYLTSSITGYNPGASINVNCLDDSATSPFGTPNPFGFTESAAAKTGGMPYAGGFTFTPVVPDASNYKFAHHAREDWNAYWSDWGGYVYEDAFVRQDGIYKKIDDAFYRKQLSIAHASTMYGLTSASTTRAPFECDARTNDCYSGACDTQVYNRGVLLEYPGLAGDGDEVVADCNRVQNEVGQTVVVCAPTKSVTVPGGGATPTFTYASIQAYPVHLEYPLSINPGISYNTLSQDEAAMDPYWDAFDISLFSNTRQGTNRTVTNSVYTYFYNTQKKYCQFDYGTNNESTTVLCSSLYDYSRPPAGGAVFFGKQGDDEVQYGGSTIIGYALAGSDSEFNSMAVVKNCSIGATDYVKVELSSMSDSDWSALMDSFKPYFQERVKAIKTQGFSDGCGDAIQSYDAVVSSIPWIVMYSKGFSDADFTGHNYFDLIGYHIASTAGQALRERNIYDEYMTSTPGTSSCEVRRDYYPWWFFESPNMYYDLAFSRYIYLFKYTPGNGKIGNCAVDDSTYLPEVRTYGWCQPCTTSTLAFQNITAYSRVYMPAYTANVEGGSYSNLESICQPSYKVNWEGFMGFRVTDNVSCFNTHITDINDYKESLGSVGSPRTSPEASILKERLGNYMKAGVMPVFDMSDASNWNINNPDAGDGSFFLFYLDSGSDDYYQQYDFQRLFGEMGASVVIVDHVSGEADETKIETIINRSNIVKEKCFGCLTAFHVDSPSSIASFNDSINSVLSDPRATFSLDMVTFDYPVSSHSSVLGGISDVKNRSIAIAEDIASYGRTALQSRRKPTMVVGLNVQSNDGYWNSNTYDELFETIVTQQDDLVKAGVTGIIYSPARSSAGGKGLVDITGSIGYKTPKFCAFQGAMQKMSTGYPVALFTRVGAVDAQNCTKCASIDKIGTGPCSEYSRALMDPRKCDNGFLCTVPDGMDEDEAKCPADTVVDTGADECALCNMTAGSYTCTLSYSNGTVDDIGPFTMSEVSNDAYMDVIAGFDKPEKCCLAGANGKKYTYVKDTFVNSINKPVVFPRTGDPNVDCGLGDTGTISELGSFCGIQLPLRDYDINCTIS